MSLTSEIVASLFWSAAPGAALLDIDLSMLLGRRVARKKSGAGSPHSKKEMPRFNDNGPFGLGG